MYVCTEGRTGHNYGNHWEGQRLRWFHKAGSHLAWQSVQRLLERERKIHVFWRTLTSPPSCTQAPQSPPRSPIRRLSKPRSFEAAHGQPEPSVYSPEQVTHGRIAKARCDSSW